jgi:hypothetical protein
MYCTATDDYPVWPTYMKYSTEIPIVGYQTRTEKVEKKDDDDDDDDDSFAALHKLSWLACLLWLN